MNALNIDLIGFIGSCFSRKKKPEAYHIIENAKNFTHYKTNPWAESFAIIEEQIIGIGSHRELDQFNGVNIKVINTKSNLIE